MKKTKSLLTYNYLFNMMYQMLIIVTPVITTPYISRVLGIENIGEYSYTNSIATVFTLFANLGTNLYGQKEIAYYRDDVHKRNVILTEILLLRGILTSVTLFFYLFFSLAVLKEYTLLFLCQVPLIIAVIFDVSWYFQGIEEFKILTIRNILVKVISILLIFLVVKEKKDLYIYTIINAFSVLISSLLLFGVLFKKKIKIRIRNVYPFKHIKGTILLFAPMVSMSIYTTADKIVLGIISGDYEVGLYTQAEKIVKIAMTVLTSLSTILLPRVSNLIYKGDLKQVRTIVEKSICFIILLGFPMVGGMVGIAENFIPLFLGKGYQGSVVLFQWLAPLVVIIGLASVTGQAVLVPLNMNKEYIKSILLAAFLNIIGNLILIPKLDSMGAVISTLIAESLVCICQQYMVIKRLNIRVMNLCKFGSRCMISTFVMYLFVKWIMQNIQRLMLAVIISIICGGIIYFVIFFIINIQYIKKVLYKDR